jgi:hypothetical protein
MSTILLVLPLANPHVYVSRTVQGIGGFVC